MAWNDHSYVGLIHIVTFTIGSVFAANLFWRRHQFKFFPWFFLLSFCYVRIAGGILVICSAGHNTVDGVVTSAYILLQVGVIPAFVVLIGLIMLIRQIDYPKSELVRKLIIGTRLYLVISIALLVTGTVLVATNENSTSPNQADAMKTANALIKAGFGCVAGLLGLLSVWGICLWVFARLTHYSRLILACYTTCIPVLAIHFAYWWLSAFSSNPKWNPLGGSVGLLIGMHTIPEWIFVGIMLTLGKLLPPMKRSEFERNYHDDEDIAYGSVTV